VSITFEYSFNSPLPFPELVDAVNRALGTTLQVDDGDVASGVLLGSTLALARNDMEDDRALNFSAYRYQLWNKTWDGDAMRSIQLETIVLAAFVLHELVGVNEGMLSYDAQRLLARYDVVDDAWCDLTDGQPVDPTAHIIDVLERLDDEPPFFG
jgi:hypothetical protein